MELKDFQQEIQSEVLDNILPFWINHTVDKDHGGFYGYINNDMEIDRKADKASVICARILWTFAKAYAMFHDPAYLSMAQRAYRFLRDAFEDKENGGIFWSVDYTGKVRDSKKQIYAQAFAIYGISEYYAITRDPEHLDFAMQLFDLLEQHTRDRVYGGYFDALAADWRPLEDTSLSQKDMNVPKTMNTNLHVLEGYTNLFRVSGNPAVEEALQSVLWVCAEKIANPATGHFMLYFDEQWNSQANVTSFGHDIEGSWLMCEAAALQQNLAQRGQIETIAMKMADTVYRTGLDTQYGGLFEAEKDGILQTNGSEWWTQAEAVVGFFNAYTMTGEQHYLDAVYSVWRFIRDHLVDRQNGEWFWGVSRDGKTVFDDTKVSEWKCPYHNSRMCFEILSRLKDWESRHATEY